MNDKIEVPTMQVPPLKRICMTIGQLPASYLETMSYYEMLVWFVNYLRDDIIPVVNANGLATQELQELFVELQNYVNNYFDNLDVQDEINNKLDEMAESGELTDIIAQYLGLAGMITFNTVAEMKLAENLVNGSKCATLGFHNVNDGGNAFYKVRTITNEDTVDEMTIIALNDNTLIAELILEFPINPKKLGAYGDGTHDDIIPIQKSINLGDVTLTSGEYYISTSINFASGRIFDGDNNVIIPASNTTAIELIGVNINNPIRETYIKNVKINTNNSGSNGIYLTNGYFNYFDNINIIQLTGNNTFGIKITNGFNHTITNSRILGNLSYTGQRGLDISSTETNDPIENMTNCKYDTILIQNLEYGVKTNYVTTSNMIDFNNLGFSACTYAYYIGGFSLPISIRNSRIECGLKTSDTYGIYIYDNARVNIDTLNIYDVKYPIYNNSQNDIQLNGQICLTGTTRSPKYIAITSNGNVVCSNEIYFTSDTYTLYSSSTIASSKEVTVSQNFVNRGEVLSSDSYNTTPGTKRIVKATNRLFNLYGLKGTELLVYSETTGIVINSYGNSAFPQDNNITMIPYQMYHIKFINDNSWTVIH